MKRHLLAACLWFFACSEADEGGRDASVSADAEAGVADAGAAEDAAAPDAPDAGPEPYEILALDRARITSRGGEPNFHRVSAPIDWEGAPFSSVKMIVQLETTCYPFETWANNPPPPGHNFPADCDAFDRNFEVHLDPVEGGEPPAIELLRAITPFGGPLTIETDVTDVANGLPGPHRVQVVIPTYSDGQGQVSGSDGGWNVSVRFEVVPGPAPRKVLAVKSLWNFSHDSNTGILPATIQVPEGTVDSRLEYRVTGHGGGTPGRDCIGPAEEFCRRTHALYVDTVLVDFFEAWRDDCDQLCTITHYGPAGGGFDYCLENPTGAIGSVRAPRANWCPGSVTPPQVWSVAELSSSGTEHQVHYTISEVLPGGIWRVSATYFAFGAD